jgi:hypothetical protein
MKQTGASTENQETAEENGAPGATPDFILDLARLSSGTGKLGQGVPAANYAGDNDHGFKGNKEN